MKEISEEWQLKIFDLLEGNLSGEEAKLLRSEIEKNADLKREFEAWQTAYLPAAEEIVYADKEKLYHNRKAWVVFKQPYHMAVAAALALLLAFGVVFMQNSKQQVITEGVVINEENGTRPEVKTASPDEMVANTPNQQKQPEAAKKVFFRLNANSAKPAFKTEILPGDSIPTFIIPDFNGLSGIRLTALPMVQGETISYLYWGNQPYPYHKKRSLNYRLLNNTRELLAQLRLPELDLKTEKGKHKVIPSLKLQLRSGDTEIMATLIE
jgi:hypothetical protein